MKKTRIIVFFLGLAIILSSIPAVSSAAGGGKKPFRILFIGNSYSEDATDGYTFTDGSVFEDRSTFCDMMRCALGEDCEIEIGLLISGGKSLTWHCYIADTGAAEYSFRVVGKSTGFKWHEYKDVRTTDAALRFFDWDAVVIQPYGPEIERGSTTTSNSGMKKFSRLSDSVPYILDFVADRVPDADVYLYLVWSKNQDNAFFAGLSKYDSIRKFTSEAKGYAGALTGKRIKTVVPVGCAVQNARSSFFTFHNSTDPSGVVSFETDPVKGLQRDELHVSYSVGRYIAALTFVRTLLDGAEPVSDPLSVPIRRPDGALPLPDEYRAAVSAAVDAALASAKLSGDREFESVDMTDYKTDPADLLISSLINDPPEVYIPDGSDEAEAVYDAIRRRLPPAASLTVSSFDGSAASVALIYGYVSREAEISLTKIDHRHVWEETESTFAHDGNRCYTVKSVCSLCGKTKTEQIEKEPCPSFRFTDTPPPGNWAHEGIDFCLTAGLMKGTSESRFSPGSTMTRAMLVTVLWRAEGEPEPSVRSPFHDLTASWYESAVSWAYGNSIVKGVGKNRFAPNDPLTREQIAAILFRYSSVKGETENRADISLFPDYGKVGGYAVDAMRWAFAEGLINGVGTSNGSFLDPQGYATRAQVATILSRYMKTRG